MAKNFRNLEKRMTSGQRIASLEKALIDVTKLSYNTREALEKLVTGLEILIFEAKEELDDPRTVTVSVPSCGVGASGYKGKHRT